jgi:hypothetical protein
MKLELDSQIGVRSVTLLENKKKCYFFKYLFNYLTCILKIDQVTKSTEVF